MPLVILSGAPLHCELYLSCCFACLLSQADHPTDGCMYMPAQSQYSHRWRLQSEPREPSSLMVIPHECRLLEKISVIFDYVSSMLPHVNADYPIGFRGQFNVYASLKIHFSKKKNRTLKLYWFVQYCHLPAAILNIWNFSRIPGWGQSNIENAGWNEAETVKNISHTKNPGWSSLTLPSGLANSGTRSHLH